MQAQMNRNTERLKCADCGNPIALYDAITQGEDWCHCALLRAEQVVCCDKSQHARVFLGAVMVIIVAMAGFIYL